MARASLCLAVLVVALSERFGAADYLVTHMYPGLTCEGNETAISTFPGLQDCVASVGGTSSSVVCIDDTLAAVTEWPTPNCTGAGNNSTVPLNVCGPENGPGTSVASVTCVRGAPAGFFLDIGPTFSQLAYNLPHTQVCGEPSKHAPFATQAIWYLTGVCAVDTPTTDVSILCDPASGNATFNVYERGTNCTGAPLSFNIYPACGELGGNKEMTVVGTCNKING